MNWLHCFWGVGAVIGLCVMSFALTHQLGWQSGYRIIGIVQVLLTVVLVLSLPLWLKRPASETKVAEKLSMRELFALPGVPQVLSAFLAYCALEATAGIWSASYLVQAREVSVPTAAKFVTLFYMGIILGRFLSGFIADRLGDRRMVWIGSSILVIGIVLVLLPLPVPVALSALLVIGLGCAPIYPTIIHETPTNFGADKSQAVIGIQMAFAYVGSTFSPPQFGLLAGKLNIGL